MNSLVLDSKEKLLMNLIDKENNKTIDEKMADQLKEKEYQDKNGALIEKDLLLASAEEMKNSIDTVFEKVFEQNGINETSLEVTLLQYYNVNTRNNYIKEFGKNTAQRNYLEKNYDKILKQVYNKWKKHVEYYKLQENIEQQKELEKQLQQELKDAKFERNVKIFFNILKWICIIIFAPIVLLFIFISMCAKDR